MQAAARYCLLTQSVSHSVSLCLTLTLLLKPCALSLGCSLGCVSAKCAVLVSDLPPAVDLASLYKAMRPSDWLQIVRVEVSDPSTNQAMVLYAEPKMGTQTHRDSQRLTET